jgi:acyl transferase domain-containing protein
MEELDDTTTDQHVAIIGMACRMPGAGGVGEFWSNLVDGVESISTFSDQELLDAGVDPALIHSPNYVRSRGIIGGADRFDAGFFGVTPREAELLDPQQRVFLECAWHALEDGGYVPGNGAAGRIAVFGGVGTNWHLGNADGHPDVRKFSSAASVVTSNDKDYLTTRVSYKLDLTGPSVNVQSACSTSLVATIMGMNSLLSHQCDLVLAGGATIEIPETKGYVFQDGGMESPDGHCRPFDAGANGTVFSRGAGVVLLKRLSEAIADGDHIYAVVLDGAINNDGGLKVGFTAPSVNGQVEVAIEALERAGVTPDTLSFVEAHGTATALGDPIEVASLSQAFRAYTDRKQFCALGSAKGNIGHTDVASGMAGLIKAALALEHGKLPASLNFESPNPKIDFEDSPFFVNTKLRELSRNGTPRRALINSFGVGGTNACAILQEPPPRTAPAPRRQEKVLLLSARSLAALDSLTNAMHDHVAAHAGADLDAMAYTCQAGRKAFQHRRAVVFGGRDELVERLSGRGETGLNHSVCEAEGRPILFAFPGQGNQYVGMGRGLYETEAVYRDAIDAAAELLHPLLGCDLREVLYPDGASAADAAALLNQTRFTQPALFATSYAQARLWMSWGVQPAAMIGHSVGEYVAGCLAGVFSFEDAVIAVARRGQLIQALPGGSMLAVLLTEADTTPLLTPQLSVAAVNGPQLTVVSGPTPAIAELEERLAGTRVFSKRLDTSHAFHSAMMDPALEDFARMLAEVPLSPPSLPIASTLTGRWLTAGEATDPGYWVQHMRKPVRFHDGLQTLLGSDSPSILLECGPGHSLASAARHQAGPGGPHSVVGSMRADGEDGSDAECLLGAVGALWMAGYAIDWRAFHGGRSPGRVPLPGYPFERQRFALDFTRNQRAAVAAKDDEKKADVGDWFYVPGWKRMPSPELAHAPFQAATADHVWLVFEDELGLAVEVHALLQQAGADVVGVRAGDGYRQLDERTFTIRPGVKSDYDELVAALKEDGRRPDRVLHLWNVDGDERPPALERAGQARALAFYSPLFLEQALINQSLVDDLRIVVAADGVFDVTGEPVTSPQKALALGPCRVVGKESPTVRARFVDVVAPRAERAAPRLAAQLVRELELDGDETVVAYRADHRWTESFDTVYLDHADDLASRLHEDGLYLVTGGLGGLGLFFAQQIAGRVRASLVLTHRTPLPARAEWTAWLDEHPQDDATSERIRGVLALEAAGATVMLAQADCADLAEMEAVVADAQARFGPVNGVIHSAGVAGGGIISLKSEDAAADVLAAKVQGTLVLDRLFGDAQLDFMLLFSSITSVLGEAGRVDYCAANNFMDAMAHHRRHDRGAAMSSVNWGSWGEFGMAARWEETKARKTGGGAKASRGEGGARLRLVDEGGEQEAYDVLLDPDEDWVANSHSVVGIPTVVGTTYLELIHDLAELKRPGMSTVIERMYFSSPLMFEPGNPKRLRLFVSERQGAHRFSFKSQALDREKTARWHEHCAGEVRLGGGEAPERVDLQALSERFDGGVDTRRFYGLDADDDVWKSSDGVPYLELGPRWDSLEEVRIGDDEWLARLELPAAFAGDLADHAFHPAMTDVALAAAVRQISIGDAAAFYLPFDYGRIQLKTRYPAAVWSHSRRLPAEPGSDTVSFEVRILDADGWELATVERYTLKKFTTAPASGRDAPAPSAPPKRLATGDSKDVLPEEGLDALQRILSAPFAPQVLVSTSSLYALIDDEGPDTGDGDDDSEDAALPVYERPTLSIPYEEPANEVERAIADIWQGILGIAQIGANDDFTELGGNSLLAVQAVATTADTYQLDLTVEAFLRNPTVRGVAGTVVELLVSLASEDTLEGLLAGLEE